MEYLILILYPIFSVWLAYNNADRIAEGKRIYHGLNGLLHLLAAVLLLPDWKAAIALLLIVRVVFDVSLNLFRKLSFCYTSKQPKSIIDKIELRLFGRNNCTPKILYLFIALCLILAR